MKDIDEKRGWFKDVPWTGCFPKMNATCQTVFALSSRIPCAGGRTLDEGRWTGGGGGVEFGAMRKGGPQGV